MYKSGPKYNSEQSLFVVAFTALHILLNNQYFEASGRNPIFRSIKSQFRHLEIKSVGVNGVYLS